MIVILCGPPSAGKTTIAIRLRNRLTTAGFPFEIVHSDEFTQRTYDQMYNRVQGSNTNWILDGTFYKQEWRERFHRVDHTRIVYVRASLATCLQRNRERKDPVDEQGAHVIYYEVDEPDADLTVNTDDLTATEAAELVTETVTGWHPSSSTA